jgi:hypothetical protein
LFLLYPLGIKYQGLKGLGFLNAYLEDNEYQWEGDVVLFLFKPSNRDKFQFWVEGEKKRTEDFIDEYDYEGGFTVLVYLLPEWMQEDLQLIKEGKYSKVSTRYRDIVPKTTWWKDATGTQTELPTSTWMIITKHPPG